MSIKVSVVIPTFKRPALLLKCLAQLARQDFPKERYEVIVVTDGIDLETVTKVTEFYHPISFFNLSCYSLGKKQGPAAARNRGAQYANGELIAFTDDDCLPQPDWISEYWKAYDALQEKEAAFTGQTVVPHSTRPTDYERNIAQLETAEFITANCAITKTAFNRVGGFDEDFKMAWREDSDMNFKLLKASIQIHPVKNATVVHPVRKAVWGVSLKEQKKGLFNALLYKKHEQLYRQKIDSTALWNYYSMLLLFFMSLTGFINGFYLLALIPFIGWLILVIEFIVRRLRSTSKQMSHIVEMIITSLLIPFLSVFWSLYGSFKYKTLFHEITVTKHS
jgi:glycosyltransferase involved in cell wall biosynthesis